MNYATFERAQLAAFVYRHAAHTGSLDCMKAIAYVIRNRVLQGWGDGTWLSVLSSARETQATNLAGFTEEQPLEADNRLLQLIIRDIDDIYFGISQDVIKTTVDEALYYQFVNLPMHEWFQINIVGRPQDHPCTATIGTLALYR